MEKELRLFEVIILYPHIACTLSAYITIGIMAIDGIRSGIIKEDPQVNEDPGLMEGLGLLLSLTLRSIRSIEFLDDVEALSEHCLGFV